MNKLSSAQTCNAVLSLLHAHEEVLSADVHSEGSLVVNNADPEVKGDPPRRCAIRILNVPLQGQHPVVITMAL